MDCNTSFISKLYTYYTSLNTPIKVTSTLYLSSIVFYNIFESYNNAKLYLNKYNNDTLSNDLKRDIKTKYGKVDKWTVITYGVTYNLFNRLWNSICFPFTIISNIISYLILKLYSKKHITFKMSLYL